MSQPIRRGVDWWYRDDVGHWHRWDPRTETWERQAGAPPPPPPPPPAFSYAPTPVVGTGGRRDRRARAMPFVAATLVILLGLVSWWRWDDIRAFAAEPAAASGQPVGSSSAEVTVYDDSQLAVSSCIRGAGAGSVQADSKAFRGLPADIRDVAAMVSGARGLTFKKQPAVSFKSEKALQADFLRRTHRHLDQFRDLLAPLYVMRIVDEKESVRSITRRIGGQVGAYYIPGKKKIVSPRAAGELSPYEKFILAHELDHALVDQRIGLFKSKGFHPSKADRDSARLALVEGDATLLMTNVLLNRFDPEEQQEAGAKAVSESDDIEKLPDFLQRSFAFPYDEGLMFACRLVNSGGWSAVDAAYENPPNSTAEILFPDRYLDGGARPDPVDPKDPPTPEGWTRRLKVAFGAADLMFMINEPAVFPQEKTQHALSVARWNGGELHFWRNGNESAAALTIVDSRGPGKAICEGVNGWFARTFDDGRRIDPSDPRYVKLDKGVALMACTKGQTRVVVAGDAATAATLLGKKNVPLAIRKALRSDRS